MQCRKYRGKQQTGAAAASHAAELINDAIGQKGEARIVIATGASQFEFLATLVTCDIDWRVVTAFHLDEYIGLDEHHPAGFRRYLNERFVSRVPDLREFVPVNGANPDPFDECRRLNERISARSIDLACIGIGENAHLAFNDPPADFSLRDPYHIVTLDEDCRSQQVNEGWFPSLEDVPGQAISMSISHILASSAIICTVPGKRKARAVAHTCEGPLTEAVPASILQRADHCHLYLDEDAASLLKSTHYEETAR